MDWRFGQGSKIQSGIYDVDFEVPKPRSSSVLPSHLATLVQPDAPGYSGHDAHEVRVPGTSSIPERALRSTAGAIAVKGRSDWACG